MANPSRLLLPLEPPITSNMGVSAHKLPPNHARVIQDALVNRPGFVIGRGKIDFHASHPNFQTISAFRLLNMSGALDPQGNERVVLVGYDTIGNSDPTIGVYDLETSTFVSIPLPSPLIGGLAGSDHVVTTSPLLGGGIVIGMSRRYTYKDGTSTNCLFWAYKGAKKATWTTSDVVSTLGSTAVTRASGGFNANVSPGMFLFSTTHGRLIGTVLSVNSDTSITLESPALQAVVAGNGVSFLPAMGFWRQVAKGTITVASAGTVVSGGGTRFKAMGMASGWFLFRASDNAFIGTVNSVTDDDTLILGAGAAVAMSEEEYFAVPATDGIASDSVDLTSTGGTYGPYLPGFLSTIYAGRQWYANRTRKSDATGPFDHRLWFSEIDNPWSVDFSTDGDNLQVESEEGGDEPIVGIHGTEAGLIICKKTETFLLTGDSPETYDTKRIYNDGCIGAETMQPYRGGVIWAGVNGIYFFDGAEVSNIVEDTLGTRYKNLTADMDTETDRAFGLVYEDHYALWVDKAAGPSNITPILSNGGSSNYHHTIVVYMPTNGLTLFTNFEFRGYHVPLSSPSTRGTRIAICISPTACRIVDLARVFHNEHEGPDAFVGQRTIVQGPLTHVQTQQYDAGRPGLRKIWKMAIAHFACETNINVDPVPGIDPTASAPPANSKLEGVGPIYLTKRIKFLKRSQYLGLRLYVDTLLTSARAFNLGPMGLIYRDQRVGRV